MFVFVVYGDDEGMCQKNSNHMFVFCILLCRVAGFIVCGKLQKKNH